MTADDPGEGSSTPAAARPDDEMVAQARELSDPPDTEPLPFNAPAYSWRFNPTEHKAKTRRLIALMILAILGVLYVVAVVAFVAHDIDSDQLIGLIAAFSGIQTLAAAAVGFYFAKGDR